MSHLALALLSVLMFAGAGACTGRTHTTVTATTVSPRPPLVQISPGVYAVAEWNQPVFYTNNSYWLWDGGRWYRSPYADRGWVYATPPRALVRLDRPYAYRYRSDGTRVQTAYRRDSRGRQVIRADRDDRGRVYRR